MPFPSSLQTKLEYSPATQAVQRAQTSSGMLNELVHISYKLWDEFLFPLKCVEVIYQINTRFEKREKGLEKLFKYLLVHDCLRQREEHNTARNQIQGRKESLNVIFSTNFDVFRN